MKAYKGFNKDMTCSPNGVPFQYEEGKEYHEDNAELCESGFHACENPLDCFSYYAPGESVYHEVELDELSDKKSDESKICGKRIKIGARLSVAKICELHFEYVKSKTTNSEQGKDKANLSAQDGSSLSAQDWSSLSARNWSSLSAQDRSSLSAQDGSSLSARNWSSLSAQDGSSLSAGKNSVIAAFNSKAKGGMNTLIALANREWKDDDYVITDFKAAIVDGEKIKPDTWYKLENGEFVEVEDEAIQYAEDLGTEEENKIDYDKDSPHSIIRRENMVKRLHRQLAGWLRELKELREENKVLISECNRLIKGKGQLLKQQEQIGEYKRLLKSAIDECHLICEWGDCGEYCCWYENGKCTQEWSGKAEALKLIGDERNEP